MNETLWRPAAGRIASSNLTRFIQALEQSRDLVFKDYDALHQWSVSEPEQFWEQVWHFTNIRSSVAYDAILVDRDKFPGARWFPGARLNFAENLLRRQDDGVAIISWLENGHRRELTHAQLYKSVSQLAAALRQSGVGPNDCVAAFMPNVPETLIGMLATASIGALWASCSPDFGLNGILDRFGQISPKILIGCDGYFYGGKTIDCLPILTDIAREISSIEQVVIVPVTGRIETGSEVRGAVWLDEYLVSDETPKLEFAQLPFEHPLYIMFSSGTTGVPKCIVHSAGGTLIQHLKEHQLHVDVKPGDVFFYFTTCGWMMWNWLVSGLASDATLLLYDGSPFHPDPNALLDIAQREKVTLFGTSAKYLAALEKAHIKPRETHDLSSLKTILSTGSPLSHESFRYVYRDFSSDVCLSSISGGTDIISCFVLGNPWEPVREGEIQCVGLGMAVEIWNDNGEPVESEKGELVCIKPFPSAPVSFWNDPQGVKYHSAYFDRYPNVWAHGDYGEILPDGGVIIHGRSDAVLNPGGVRIGTAEIYRQVEKVDEVLDCVCVGQQWQDDVRVILFVIVREGVELTDDLSKAIRDTIRHGATPRHVPAKIISVPDIPRTRSGKTAELAVRNVIHGEIVKNTDALANPESLGFFRQLSDLER